MNPKVSIIVPIYNMSKYLSKCLDGLVNQTLKDIEIICVDDCSTDNSVEICKGYANTDSRIRIIEQETNQGSGAARNCAINSVQGEYLYFMDPDDEIEENFAELTYNKAKEHDADIVVFDYEKVFMQNNTTQQCSPVTTLQKWGFDITPDIPYNFKEHLEYSFKGTLNYPWIRLFRTQFVKENNIRFGTSRRGQDKPFAIEAKLLADKIVYLDKTLYHFRIWRDNQFIFNDGHFDLFRDMRKVVYRNTTSKEVEKELNEYLVVLSMRQYLGRDKEGRKQLIEETKDALPYREYLKFMKKVKKYQIQQIFSIKNQEIYTEKYKVLTILGKEFKFKKK